MCKILVCALCGRRYAEPANRCSADGSALCGPEALGRVGHRLGNYDIHSIEGVGGMGVVYKAKHHLLGKPVAIKVLHERYAGREGAVDQFLREAQAATRIRHPNIVDVTDFGVAPDGSVYFVMEHLEGISLEDVLARDGTVPLFNAVNIVRQTARALAAAHDEGIVHRDLKPENIFLINREGRRRVVRSIRDGDSQRFVVEKEGNFDFVKLLDFGVAKFTMDDVGPGMSTRAGMIFGTPHYMSPEQARGEGVDGRSDVYALGIVFYEMVTGAVPFDGEAALDILNGHVYGAVVPPKDRVRGFSLDDGTNETILRCLEKEPGDRYQTMWELIDALASCFTDQVFLRDAHHMPGAVESGVIPSRELRPPPPAINTRARTTGASDLAAAGRSGRRSTSITAELSELFASSREEIVPESMRETAKPVTAPPSRDASVVLLTPQQVKTPTGVHPRPSPSKSARQAKTHPGLGVITDAMVEAHSKQTGAEAAGEEESKNPDRSGR